MHWEKNKFTKVFKKKRAREGLPQKENGRGRVCKRINIVILEQL